jgi:AraC family transcriptional regulator
MSSQSKSFPRIQDSQSLIFHDQTNRNGLRLMLRSDSAGYVESPAFQNTIVGIQVGRSVHISCHRGGYRHRGLAVYGDIEVIPSGIPSIWEIGGTETAFYLSIPQNILSAVAEDLQLDPNLVEIRNRFQMRDPQIENIGWALKAEMECGYPSGQLYIDGLALAVTARLVRDHSSASINPKEHRGKLPGLKLKQVLSYIDENLEQNISLQDLAAVSGFSVSHFKTLFRESVGLPVHQYLIRRRVERARSLLADQELSISQIAFKTGFAHQSHLAYHMRRLLGVSPKAAREIVQ